MVTVRAQTFSATQQARARTNIGAAAAAELTADEAALAKVQESLAYIVGDTNTSGQALAVGTYIYVRGHATIPDGLRKVIGSSAIATGGAITTSNTEAESGGVINSLSGNITKINLENTTKFYSGNTTRTLTLGTSSLYMIVIGSSTAGYNGIYLVYTGGSSILTCTEVLNATGITVTYSGLDLSFAFSTGANKHICAIKLATNS